MSDESDIFEKLRKLLGFGEGQNPITKSKGVNISEERLQSLGSSSFLSLWSYPNPYKSKGDELCDLLVVCGNHVLIFSDKQSKYLDKGDEKLAWKRWYERAIGKSIGQINGAERWLRKFPNKIFLDAKCEQGLPLKLPSSEKMIVHRIAVARGISEACKNKFEGSGSLRFDSNIKDGSELFTVGNIETTKGFVHVINDNVLDIILNTLDTLPDFVDYLTKKEAFLKSGNSIIADGEENLLINYLKSNNGNNEHDFLSNEDDDIIVKGNLWGDFTIHPKRTKQIELDQNSYFWDTLIEKFSKHVLSDTQYFVSHVGIEHTEEILRYMAKESRFRRRIISSAIIGLIKKSDPLSKGVRIIAPSKEGEPYYVILLLPSYPDESEEEYRTRRGNTLYEHCLVTKKVCPDALDIIGIAAELNGFSGEDALYLDARDWTDELQKKATTLQNELEIFKNIVTTSRTVKKNPTVNRKDSRFTQGLKGRDRNKACVCGSGIKQKRCCGK